MLVKLNPSLFDHLTRTARKDMKNLDRELRCARVSCLVRAEKDETDPKPKKPV